MAAGSGGGLDTIVVSIHGSAGVLDLVVPPGAGVSDIAREYAEQTSLGSIPLLCTGIGEALGPDRTLRDAGVESGDVLVAMTSVHRPTPTAGADGAARAADDRLGDTWFWLAAALAAAAGWFASRAGTSDGRLVAVGLLLAAALVGVLPVGRHAHRRVLVAPAFAAAAVFALVWDPSPDRFPLTVGIAALAAATTAAVGRALSSGTDEGLRVWMVAGTGLFALALVAALLGLRPAVVWAVVLALAVLAARFVPGLAVDVPDQHLIDLERLAVTAWSAREPRAGRRGRIVVRRDAVATVAASATRTMTAAAAAVAATAPLAALQLLTLVDAQFDRTGARFLVFFAGAALVLTARSHRHTGVRTLLRVAGLGCWGLLAWQLLLALSEPRRAALLGVAIALGLLLILVAVATGRGWRSIWWSRRAEVAEGFAAAAALASVVVATGLFRSLWEAVP